MMNPATLSIIAATFPPRERGTAIGIWAGVSALALAIGPLVGGLLTEHASWNWIFFVNVPVGILGIVASFLLIDESRDTTHERLDLPGLATSAIGLFALTFGLIEANTYGWGSPRIVGAFVVAAVALVGFVLLERHQRAPMLDLSLFRNRTYTGANLVVLLVALAMFGVFFFMSLYMQTVLGFSAFETGATFLPMTILIILVAPVAGRVSDRVGSRGLITTGMLLVAAQLLYFSRLDADASFWNLLPGLIFGGVGMALTMTPGAAAATRAIPVDKAGVGSAVLNAARQVGGSIGVALMGAIMAAQLASPPTVSSFMKGFEQALTVAAGIAIAGAVVAAVLIRPHDTREHGERTVPAEAARAHRPHVSDASRPTSAAARSSRRRSACSRRGATRAPRRPRSPGRRASPSRSSTATSRRSATFGRRASRPRGRSSARGSTRRSPAARRRAPVRRRQRAGRRR
jgi:EmrB/QacA subfamily drug resistance transporter